MPTFWSLDFGASAQHQQEMAMSDATNKPILFDSSTAIGLEQRKRKPQDETFARPQDWTSAYGFLASKRSYVPQTNGFTHSQTEPPAAFVKAWQAARSKHEFVEQMATTSSSPIDIAGCDANGNQIMLTEEKSYTNTCVTYYSADMDHKDTTAQDVDMSMDCTENDGTPLSAPKSQEGMRTPERRYSLSPDTARQAGGYSPRQVQSFCRMPYTDVERCCGFRSEFY